MIRRFSSLREHIHESFLTERLKGAKAYDRIAGYFSSSILEVAGEALESVSGPIRVICNSDLSLKDVETARAAKGAVRQEWCKSEPEHYPEAVKGRFKRLYDFLTSGRLIVKVLPSEKFGLIHGKAGVVTRADGTKTAFLGSVNETRQAWEFNYELLWEDDSDEAVRWVEEEFRSLWESPFAVPLPEYVIEDIKRLSRRTTIEVVEKWRTEADPASLVVESPISRKEEGLAEHQKYFIKKAFEAHKGPHGARLVLADGVGLGKTAQLAMAAQLMALYGTKPILILVPKTILFQWQDELRDLLDLPSAVWNGKQWIDENSIAYPGTGPEDITRCPRKIGIVSQGLIVRGSAAGAYLKELSYECIIIDEAHRARRKNLGPGREDEKPDTNNLLKFLLEIAARTKSLLLATATPVQLYPVEALDLMNILGTGTDSVLGNLFSLWRKPSGALNVIMGRDKLPDDELDLWAWIRNPMPPADEHLDFEILRKNLSMTDSDVVVSGGVWEQLSKPDRQRIRLLGARFAKEHNPFIRHIVRRTREYLEATFDPETKEPYLTPIKVELYGESDDEAILLPPYLRDAYRFAEEFCRLLSQRMKGTGFLKTLLLRRVGSTIVAGRNTAEKLLSTWTDMGELEEEEDDIDISDELKTFTSEERQKLTTFLEALEANKDKDPKLACVIEYLIDRNWIDSGCIVFSQYYDSIEWLSRQLSERLPDENIGIYAGSQKSGIIKDSLFHRTTREDIKAKVRQGEIRLLLGTEAASEGLNLQRLGTLINLDLPWNPTRLEQRKGRIQRMGQVRDTVKIYNMRYADSVEDRVHQLLSERLQHIYRLFGQLPDVLEDVWIDVALGEIERAKQIIDEVPEQHPFELRYSKVEKLPWESCARVLDKENRKKYLSQGW